MIYDNATGCCKRRITGNSRQCHSFVVMRTDFRLQSIEEWWFPILKVNVACVCSFILFIFQAKCPCKEGQNIISQNSGKREGIARE